MDYKRISILLLIIFVMSIWVITDTCMVRAAGTYKSSVTSFGGRNFTNPVKCHLQYNVDDSVTIMYSVVINSAQALYIRTVNSSGETIDLKIVPVPGTTWGGCIYKGTDGYIYVATGNGSDALWYFTKFTSDWVNVGTAKITGDESYTYKAYDGGNCDMTMQGKYLIAHAARIRPMTSDGLRHQSNTTFYIDTDTMMPVYVTGRFGFDHVGHSFNQFVRNNNGRIITVDHGDGYPRSIYLQSWLISDKDMESGQYYSNKKNLTLMEIRGNIGDNYTGVTVDGFEPGKNNNIVAGTSIPHYKFTSDADFNAFNEWDEEESNKYNDYTCNNIYIILVGKDLKSSQTVWLTNYGHDCFIDRMKFIKIDYDNFLILYGLRQFVDEDNNAYYTCYIKVNSSGEIIGSGLVEKEFLDASEPDVLGNNVVWCHYIESGLGNFLTLKRWNLETGNIDIQNIPARTDTEIASIEIEVDDKLEIDKIYEVEANIYPKQVLESLKFEDAIAVWNSSDSEIVELLQEETLIESGSRGTDGDWHKYVYTHVKAKKAGTAILTCTVGNKQKQVKIKVKGNVEKPLATKITKLKKKDKNGFVVKWKKMYGVSGYQLSYSKSKKFLKAKKKIIKDWKKGSKTVKELSKGKKYYVRIRAYIDDDGEMYYGKWSKARSIIFKK